MSNAMEMMNVLMVVGSILNVLMNLKINPRRNWMRYKNGIVRIVNLESRKRMKKSKKMIKRMLIRTCQM